MKRSFVPVLIILIIASLIAAVLILGKNKLNRFVSINSPIPTSTTNWKTYTNNDWGVSFKYPEKLVYNGSAITLKEIDKNNVELEASTDWGISFQRIQNKTINQRVIELPSLVLNSPQEIDLGNKKINGYDAREIIFKYDQGDNHRFLIQHGLDLIEINTGFVVNADDILSTFKFTN